MAAPGDGWQERRREFERIAEQPPYDESVKKRLIGLLNQENQLVDSLDEAGMAGSLGEGFAEYVSDLVVVVYRIARQGNKDAAHALIGSPLASGGRIGELLNRSYWREWLAYELIVPPLRRIRYSQVPAHLGLIYGIHSTEMEPTLRQRIERRLLDGLQSEDEGTRLNSILAVKEARLKSALPILLEKVEALKNESAAGRRVGELKFVLESIKALESLP
jgi:hypothetical protein